MSKRVFKLLIALSGPFLIEYTGWRAPYPLPHLHAFIQCGPEPLHSLTVGDPHAWACHFPSLQRGLSNHCAGVTTNAVRLRIRVVNMSLGGPGDPASSLCSALNTLVMQGVTVVVAAGEAVGQYSPAHWG